MTNRFDASLILTAFRVYYKNETDKRINLVYEPPDRIVKRAMLSHFCPSAPSSQIRKRERER